jgi:hypothetical protein
VYFAQLTPSGTLPNPKSLAGLLHLGVACDDDDDHSQVSKSQVSRVHVGTYLTRSPSGQGMWRYLAVGRSRGFAMMFFLCHY